MHKYNLPGDEDSVVWYTFNLELTTVSRDTGFLWKSEENVTFVSGYSTDLKIITSPFFKLKFGLGYKVFCFLEN